MELDENIKYTSENIFKLNNIIIYNLINSIDKNHLSFDNNFPLLFEKNYNNLYLLNNKRFSS